MIADKILDIVFGFVNSFLDALPLMEIESDFAVMYVFLDIISAALYFFPWQKVLPILGIIMALQVWRIVVSVIKAVWSILPFV